MANYLQIMANGVMMSKGLYWVCRREVVVDGSCFYDSTLACTEDKAIAKTLAKRFFQLQREVREDPEFASLLAKMKPHLAAIRVLRLAVALFMERNETLHGLEWFKIYKEQTLADEFNKGRSWEEYIYMVRYTNSFADQLTMICTAMLCGKDIMQTGPEYPKSDPWVQIPGKIDGWPYPTTKPDITIYHTGMGSLQHFEPIMYIGYRRMRMLRRASKESSEGEETEDIAKLKMDLAAYREKINIWCKIFRKQKDRAPTNTDFPQKIKILLQKTNKIQKRIEALEMRQAQDASFNNQMRDTSRSSRRAAKSLKVLLPMPVTPERRLSVETIDSGFFEESNEEKEKNEEDGKKDALEEDGEKDPLDISNMEIIIEEPTIPIIEEVEEPNSEEGSKKENPAAEVDPITEEEIPAPPTEELPAPAVETPTKPAIEEENAGMLKTYHDFSSKIIKWQTEFQREKGRKPLIYERTPEIKMLYKNCEYILGVVKSPPTVQGDNVAEIKDVAKTATEAKEQPKTGLKPKLSALRTFRRQFKKVCSKMPVHKCVKTGNWCHCA